MNEIKNCSCKLEYIRQKRGAIQQGTVLGLKMKKFKIKNELEIKNFHLRIFFSYSRTYVWNGCNSKKKLFNIIVPQSRKRFHEREKRKRKKDFMHHQ
jgi:hypothetical protein